MSSAGILFRATRTNLQFNLLGPVEALGDGEVVDLGPFKQRALLALLLLNGYEVDSTRQFDLEDDLLEAAGRLTSP